MNLDDTLRKLLVDLWSRNLVYTDVKNYVAKLTGYTLHKQEWDLFSNLLSEQYNRDMGETL